jgi:hypothetical protein
MAMEGFAPFDCVPSLQLESPFDRTTLPTSKKRQLLRKCLVDFSTLCYKKMGAKRLLFPPIWERDQYLTLPRLFSVTGLATVAGKSRLSRIFYRLRHVSAFLVVLTGLASLHKHLTSSIPQPHFPTAGDTFLSRPYPHEVALHATRGSMSCGVIPYFRVKACGGYATVEQKDRATPDRTISRDVC